MAHIRQETIDEVKLVEECDTLRQTLPPLAPLPEGPIDYSSWEVGHGKPAMATDDARQELKQWRERPWPVHVPVAAASKDILLNLGYKPGAPGEPFERFIVVAMPTDRLTLEEARALHDILGKLVAIVDANL